MPRRWATCSTRSTMPTPASPEPRRYRGALIGAGGIARQSHLPALRGAAALRARVDVVAVVDSAPGVPPVDGIPLLRDHAALLDLAGMPSAVSAWTGRLRHAGYDVEDTAALRFEYPDRLATMFFTWAGRARENRIRFVGDAGMIEWVDGELRLERGGAVERLDFAAELEKTAYQRWFACLFETFVAALDTGDAGTRFLDDIGRVASVVEHAYAAARSGATVAIPDGV